MRTNRDPFKQIPPRYSSRERSRIVVLPVPFDKTSSYVRGSSKGPAALIDASYYLEYYDIETKTEVIKRGIHIAPPVKANTSSQMIQRVRTTTLRYLEDEKFVVALGGEHTISLGAIQAHAQTFGPLSVLQLDAHTDLRDSYFNDPLSHACVMARVQDIDNVQNIVAVGIRSNDTSEFHRYVEGNIFYAPEIAKTKNWMSKTVQRLEKNVYVTIDVDVFDPSIMPATGTPEPGGLSWVQVTNLLHRVSEEKNVVGFDIVELCPDPIHKHADFTAAKLMYTFLSYCFATKHVT